MSESKQLIEKLGLAIHGERPRVVVSVLVAFTQAVLDRWGITTEEYVVALCGGVTPMPREVAQAPSGGA